MKKQHKRQVVSETKSGLNTRVTQDGKTYSKNELLNKSSKALDQLDLVKVNGKTPHIRSKPKTGKFENKNKK